MAIKQMQQWGLANAHLEPWDFGHVGWLNERLTAHLISPVKDPLVCEVLSWTPSTRGPVRASAYQFVLSRAADARSIDGILRKRKSESARADCAGRQTQYRAR